MVRYSCPIYAEYNPTFRTPGIVQCGSGVFYKDEKGGYLITASHVLNELPEGKIIVGSLKRTIHVKGNTIDYKSSIDFDLAALQMKEEDRLHFEQEYYFFTKAEIHHFTSLNKNQHLILLGYPNTLNKSPKTPNLNNKRGIFYYGTNKIIDLNTVSKKNSGKHPLEHFAVKIDLSEAYKENSEPPILKELKGISGGLVLLVETDRTGNLILKKSIIGIIIESPNKKTVICTHFSTAIGLIHFLPTKKE